MTRNTALAVLALAALLVAVSLLAYSLAGDALLGSDTNALRVIEQIDPEYAPWFTSRIHLSASTEKGLFALQAALGVALIGYYVVSRRRRVRSESEERDHR